MARELFSRSRIRNQKEKLIMNHDATIFRRNFV